MTSKQRAELRAQANRLEPVFHVGKEGVTDAVAKQMLEAFHTRELLKGKALLETVPQPPRETAEALARMTGAEVVQVVGGSMIFFKENPELHEPQKAKPKAAPRPGKAAAPKPRRAARQRKALHEEKKRQRRG
ncbi:MAG: YhbY family RNA-binding protein [Oscillospiraceae bacterium]|nr:YhbY family RNA-binding protein [Oscillospiraceae bacterium]